MNVPPEGNVVVDSESALAREYKDIFIKVKKWGAFEWSDVRRNGLNILYTGTAPEFVVDFEQKLNSKPCLAPDVCRFLDHSFDADRM